MTSGSVTATAETSVAEAMSHMTSGRFRHIPVMQGDEVDGLVSIGDLVKHRLSEMESENKALLEYITARLSRRSYGARCGGRCRGVVEEFREIGQGLLGRVSAECDEFRRAVELEQPEPSDLDVDGQVGRISRQARARDPILCDVEGVDQDLGHARAGFGLEVPRACVRPVEPGVEKAPRRLHSVDRIAFGADAALPNRIRPSTPPSR